MSIQKLCLYTSAIAMIGATAALAEPITPSTNIDALPEEGVVSLTGTVDSVDSRDSFTLRDAAGNTIDVHTSAPLAALDKGDTVRVQGDIHDEIAGFGEEITAATVEVIASPTAMKTKNSATTTTNVSDKTYDATIGDKHIAVNVDVDKVHNAETRQDRLATTKRDMNAQARRNINPNNNYSAAYDVDVDTKVSELAPAAGGNAPAASSLINNLPKEGPVLLTGTVDDVNNGNKFILRDAQGETIDINTKAKIAVNEGDRVSVTGKVQPEIAGMGREIVAANVIKLSQK